MPVLPVYVLFAVRIVVPLADWKSRPDPEIVPAKVIVSLRLK